MELGGLIRVGEPIAKLRGRYWSWGVNTGAGRSLLEVVETASNHCKFGRIQQDSHRLTRRSCRF